MIKSIYTYIAVLISSALQFTVISGPAQASELSIPVCVYIASYSPDKTWQKDLELSIQQNLNGFCDMRTHYMHASGSNTEAELIKKGEQAKSFIKIHAPELVIVSDDYAVKYLLEPYYKNTSLPFVFCGLNARAHSYGLPYLNATGMIEFSPIYKLIRELHLNNLSIARIAYLQTPGISEELKIQRFKKMAQKLSIEPKVLKVNTEAEWQSAYVQLQKDSNVDLIVLGDIEKLPTWNKKANVDLVSQYNLKPSVTDQYWVMPYASFGQVKRAEEQGRWAALSAMEVLSGRMISKLEIVPNRESDIWVNENLSQNHRQYFPKYLLKQARFLRQTNGDAHD